MFIPFSFHLPPIPRVWKVTFMTKRKVRSKLLNFLAELNLAAQVLKDGCLLSRKQMIYWFPIKREHWQELWKQKPSFSRAFKYGTAEIVQSLKSSAGGALQCLLWIPVPALPWPHLGFALCSGVTCHNDNCASLSRLLRFWISEECQSPLRAFFPFSLFFFSFLSRSWHELQDSFQVFLHFMRTEKMLSKILWFLKPIFFSIFILFYCNSFLQILAKNFLDEGKK